MTNTDIVTELDQKRNEKFITTKKGRKIVCLHNTQIILNMMDIQVYYDVIKKHSYMKSNDKKLNGDIIDYSIVKILDFATMQNYIIGKNTLTDHVMAIARDHSINKVADFFEQARLKWDGISRIEEVFNTIPSKTIRWYALSAFKKWCIQAVKLANNEDGKMNQEYVLVLQGGQKAGKTSFFNLLIPIHSKYIKEGLTLNPDNKDSIIECISHFLIELGELDSTMKHEQAKLKAFITRKWDEVRKPYDRLPERTPRQSVLCASVNDEQFLKDKTGNRRYAIIKLNDGERIDLPKLEQIDLEQFWGEIAQLAYEGADHKLNDEESEQQTIENNDFEMLTETEIRIETGFNWGADEKHWRKISTANICETLGLNSKSKNVGQTLKRKGCIPTPQHERPRGWTVPPFMQDRTNLRSNH